MSIGRIAEHEAAYMRCLVYPSVATLAGQSATAFRVGRPVRFAALLAREIGGFTKPEGFDA